MEPTYAPKYQPTMAVTISARTLGQVPLNRLGDESAMGVCCNLNDIGATVERVHGGLSRVTVSDDIAPDGVVTTEW